MLVGVLGFRFIAAVPGPVTRCFVDGVGFPLVLHGGPHLAGDLQRRGGDLVLAQCGGGRTWADGDAGFGAGGGGELAAGGDSGAGG
jgi:hypothetical protein